MLKLEPRPQSSRAWSVGSPLLALVVTGAIGVLLFLALGKDPVRGLLVFCLEPVRTPDALVELVVQPHPLLILAPGLAVRVRPTFWDLGPYVPYVI